MPCLRAGLHIDRQTQLMFHKNVSMYFAMVSFVFIRFWHRAHFTPLLLLPPPPSSWCSLRPILVSLLFSIERRYTVCILMMFISNVKFDQHKSAEQIEARLWRRTVSFGSKLSSFLTGLRAPFKSIFISFKVHCLIFSICCAVFETFLSGGIMLKIEESRSVHVSI